MSNTEYLKSLVHEIIENQGECEWVEFKKDYKNQEDIGKYISALSNSALLHGKDKAYVLWGIDNDTHEVSGTSFNPAKHKIGNEELENWLLQRLNPRINFTFHKIAINEKTIVLLEINAASKHPTTFTNERYIRIGSYTKNLKDFQEKERELWRMLEHTPFELQLAVEHIDKDKVFDLIDYPAYFDLIDSPLPDGHQAILETLITEELVQQDEAGQYAITNLGAILFAKDLNNFDKLKRKAIRVIQYEGTNKTKAIREQRGSKGYAVSFDKLIEFVMALIPAEESLDSPLRKEKTMLPELAIRELIANALIHQDFSEAGSSVMIELFADRLEITNPGKPIVDIDRFLDAPPKSRNEKLAALMRRINICEQRGSGVDKVFAQVELNQLPAPLFEIPLTSTRIVLFAYRELKHLGKQERISACYFHAYLKYIQREYMTNTSLRTRLGIDANSLSITSNIIKSAIEKGLICVHDETVGSRARKYVPAWAKN